MLINRIGQKSLTRSYVSLNYSDGCGAHYQDVYINSDVYNEEVIAVYFATTAGKICQESGHKKGYRVDQANARPSMRQQFRY